jgi:hypothetical protein
MDNIKLKIYNYNWQDNIILDYKNNTLYRESNQYEKAKFNLIKNILYINWDNWDSEYFIYQDDPTIFYKVEKIHFYDEQWNDICYIDTINNKIYKNSSYEVGIFENLSDNEIIIEWAKYTLHNNQENIKIIYNKNQNIKLEKIKNINEYNYFNNTIDNTIDNTIKSNTSNIPNIIHFVFGFKKQTIEFELYRYLAIKSAIDINQPDKVYFHYKHLPYGPWWDKIKDKLILEYVEPPSEIYGNDIYHYAHQADIIRLQKLIKYGGIYLDIDTICLKSFKDLLNYKFVMGVQSNKNNSDIYGLCNAIILSEKKSEFAIRWIDEYTNFRSKGRDIYWDEHSVQRPLKLAYQFPHLITILDHNSFYNPLWYDIHDYLFNEELNINNYKDLVNTNYCIHLWDTYTNDYLSKLNEDDILNKNTIYNILARKFIKNTISIVMLTYNRLDITKKCLESYLNALNLEIIEEMIILDNNSDNDMIEYLKIFKNKNKKIRIIYSKENLGVCGGRLQLFSEAKGSIIASLDSDACLESASFFNKVANILYDEKYGIVGISGAYLTSWEFGKQQDIEETDYDEYYCHHIAGCCQVFRKDLFLFGFGLDSYYGKFWVEDTDLSMQSLYLNKINYRISSKNLMNHQWGGSGKFFYHLFEKNWNYFKNKWKHKVLTHLIE